MLTFEDFRDLARRLDEEYVRDALGNAAERPQILERMRQAIRQLSEVTDKDLRTPGEIGCSGCERLRDAMHSAIAELEYEL